MPPEDRPHSLPILLMPNPAVDNSARIGLQAMAWGLGISLLFAISLWWSATKHDASAAGTFLVVVLSVMLLAVLVIYRRVNADSERFIIIAHDSLWLGTQEIEWSRITAPAIEEIEQETGPADYRVAFCVIGEQTFGTWRYLNPRLYTSRVSAKTAAEVLCGCLNEARRRALTHAFDDSDAEMPLSPFLRVTANAVPPPSSIRELSLD